METKITIFSEILRDLESQIGTRDVSQLVLRAFNTSMKDFKPKSHDDIKKQFENLVHIISNTKPRFGVLTNFFNEIVTSFDEKSPSSYNSNKCKLFFDNKINNLLKSENKDYEHLLSNATDINVKNKRILIHDHSHTVHDVLLNYKKKKINFNVVIAEQETDKTHSNIEFLHEHDIPFQVVPAYMISHIYNTIDIAFFGALTLKDTMHFVMDPGSSSLISELFIAKIPSYMFLEVNKFSLWKSKKRGEVFMHEHKRRHHNKPIEYNRIKYSHDRVSTEFFEKIITDKESFTQKGIKKYFDSLI